MSNELYAFVWNSILTIAALALGAYLSAWVINSFEIAERFQLWITVGIGFVFFSVVFISFSAPAERRR